MLIRGKRRTLRRSEGKREMSKDSMREAAVAAEAVDLMREEKAIAKAAFGGIITIIK